jgi:hypothetical protein
MHIKETAKHVMKPIALTAAFTAAAAPTVFAFATAGPALGVATLLGTAFVGTAAGLAVLISGIDEVSGKAIDHFAQKHGPF